MFWLSGLGFMTDRLLSGWDDRKDMWQRYLLEKLTSPSVGPTLNATVFTAMTPSKIERDIASSTRGNIEAGRFFFG